MTPPLPRVLIVHNAYQQRGGEDVVVEAEMELLRVKGHEVSGYLRHNDDLRNASTLSIATDIIWSARSFQELRDRIVSFRPDVLHIHNTHALISPSAYWAAARMGVPVVQTLHNYRLLCPQGMLLRNEQVCEDCVGHVPWRGVVRRCYRNSIGQSGALAAMVTAHRALGTYTTKIARYIALSEFCRAKFVEGGLPADKIRVKPNFVNDHSFGITEERVRRGLFVGRLTAEKGIAILAEAMRIAADIVSLDVIGTGPDKEILRNVPRVEMLGYMQSVRTAQRMATAPWLVVPSVYYEPFGLVVIEAFACATPVIASRIGTLAGLVEEGVTGLLFRPGDARDLSEKMLWAQSHPQEMRRMGITARSRYLSDYGAETNYHILADIYGEAISEIPRKTHVQQSI